VLDLTSCDAKNDGATAMATALAQGGGARLQELMMGYNEIGPEGGVALARAMAVGAK
jgi:hypothetical protein